LQPTDQRSAAAYHPSLILGTTLTFVAGFVDSVGYVSVGQFYLAFMSGNTTRLGMSLAAGDNDVAAWGVAIIATFVAGAFIGSLLASIVERAKILLVLGGEIICFGATCALLSFDLGRPALLPITLAMGMQNTIHQAVSGAETGRSFITGTLFGLGQSLAQAAIGRGRYATAGIHLVIWLAFTSGVILGALILSRLGVARSLLIAPGALVITAIVEAILITIRRNWNQMQSGVFER
jgi:oxalate decarboxylase